MRLIPKTQLYISSEELRLNAGEAFEVHDELGKQLLASGKAYRPLPPKIQYETKVITPEAPEVGPRPLFRDLPVSDEKQTDVASESDPVLPKPNVSAQGTIDPGRRRGRA